MTSVDTGFNTAPIFIRDIRQDQMKVAMPPSSVLCPHAIAVDEIFIRFGLLL